MITKQQAHNIVNTLVQLPNAVTESDLRNLKLYFDEMGKDQKGAPTQRELYEVYLRKITNATDTYYHKTGIRPKALLLPEWLYDALPEAIRLYYHLHVIKTGPRDWQHKGATPSQFLGMWLFKHNMPNDEIYCGDF